MQMETASSEPASSERRVFLQLAGGSMVLMATTALGVGRTSAQESASQSKTTIYSGGPILTMDDAQPSAEAVAVRDGRIIAVGTLIDVEKLAGADAARRDLKGLALLPGFYDPHGHVSMVGTQAISANLLPPPDGAGDSIADLQAIYREWIEKNQPFIEKYGIILGFGYDDAQFEEKRHPTRQDLDAISTEFPILAMHQSVHLGAVNSKALELGGITADTPNPEGGVFRREPGSNEPNGVVEEKAFYLMMEIFLRRLDFEANLDMAKAGAMFYAQFGYTTAQDAASSADGFAVLKALADRGGLPIDVVAFPVILTPLDSIKQLIGGDYVNRLRIGGVKLTIDGSPQGKTAWLSQPYYVPPDGQGPEYAGYPQVAPALVMEKIEEAIREGWQIQVHANGDAAIDLMIAGVKAALAKHDRPEHRSVLIHGQTTREDQVDAMKELGIMPSFFPMHTYYWGDWHRDSVLGPVRAENISPTGWAHRRGMRFTSHHDAPVANPDSMRVLSATVTRRTRSRDILGPHQRVSVEVALKAMTLWAAWQHFEDANKGSIEVGKLADLVLLSADPTTVDPDELEKLQVMETIKEGVSVYRKP